MSRAEQIKQLLADNPDGLTAVEIRARLLRQCPISTVCATLKGMIDVGSLERDGTGRHYRYRLPAGTRSLHDLEQEIAARIRALLALSDQPTTIRQIRDHTSEYETSAVGAVLGKLTAAGVVQRSGIYMRYSYRLNDQASGQAADKTRVPRVRQPSVPVVPQEVRQAQAQASQIRTTGMPPRSPVPSPGVSPTSLLPWSDEEEAPPCIGERWRDALRPRPIDD